MILNVPFAFASSLVTPSSSFCLILPRRHPALHWLKFVLVVSLLFFLFAGCILWYNNRGLFGSLAVNGNQQGVAVTNAQKHKCFYIHKRVTGFVK